MLASDEVVLDDGASVTARGATVRPSCAICCTRRQCPVAGDHRHAGKGRAQRPKWREWLDHGRSRRKAVRQRRVGARWQPQYPRAWVNSPPITARCVSPVRASAWARWRASLRVWRCQQRATARLAARELILDSRSSLDIYGRCRRCRHARDQCRRHHRLQQWRRRASFSADSIVLANANARNDAGAQGVTPRRFCARMTAREIRIGRGRLTLKALSNWR